MVIDDPAVNAFALPGGFIYLTRGILGSMSTEAKMVSVLGHEIGQVTARHAVERLSKAQLASLGLVAGMIVSPDLRDYGNLAQAGPGVLFLKFSRDDERQADDLGFRYMNQAGYDPRQMVEMFRALDRVSAVDGAGRLPDWLATHPNPGDRIERIEQDIARTGPSSLGTEVERRPFLEQIDGIVFGPNPREGYFDGSTFYPPELAFQVRFPEGWTTENRRDAVVATSPGEDAAVALSLEAGKSAGDVADGRLDYRSAFESSMGSFGRPRDRRHLDVQPKRVELVTLPEAMTLQRIAERYPSTVDVPVLAIINQVEEGGMLEAGGLYKRIVGGELP